jgi:uncharacterized protein YndB with AHSA1/START domain
VSRRTLTIDRTFQASLDDVWTLWTTAEGIESWWGPDGFSVKVRKLELRPGGALAYAMTATGPEQIAFMNEAGMPLTIEHRATYVEITPQRRLAFTQLADFMPGVEPYDVAMVAEFHPRGDSVQLVLTIDAMHDEYWTTLAVSGWESELGKLAKALADKQQGDR